MRTDDQWFEPGDKVMRVADWTPDDGAPICKKPDYGTVYCVEEFAEGEGGCPNILSFVGDGGLERIGGELYGWPAAAFRRVSEIQLCVRAAKHLSEPVEKETVETQNA